MDIGKKIKEYRKIYNISQADFGGMVGVNKQTVSKWENGKLQPSIYKFYEIASVIGIPAKDILKDENQQDALIYRHRMLDVGLNSLYRCVHNFDSFYAFIDAIFVTHNLLDSDSQHMGFLLADMTYKEMRVHDEAVPINHIYCAERSIIIDTLAGKCDLKEGDILNIKQASACNNEVYGFNIYLKGDLFLQLILGLAVNG